jgi:hypothetical protein
MKERGTVWEDTSGAGVENGISNANALYKQTSSSSQ